MTPCLPTCMTTDRDRLLLIDPRSYTAPHHAVCQGDCWAVPNLIANDSFNEIITRSQSRKPELTVRIGDRRAHKLRGAGSEQRNAKKADGAPGSCFELYRLSGKRSTIPVQRDAADLAVGLLGQRR